MSARKGPDETGHYRFPDFLAPLTVAQAVTALVTMLPIEVITAIRMASLIFLPPATPVEERVEIVVAGGLRVGKWADLVFSVKDPLPLGGTWALQKANTRRMCYPRTHAASGLHCELQERHRHLPQRRCRGRNALRGRGLGPSATEEGRLD